MNKKNNRKGFTTVELVIVIAVIAILATVLIPTFSNLINDANESAALQEANSALKTWMADPANAQTFTDETVLVIVAKGKVFVFEDNKLSQTPKTAGTDAAPTKLPCGATLIGTLPTGFAEIADKHDFDVDDDGTNDQDCACGAKQPA